MTAVRNPACLYGGLVLLTTTTAVPFLSRQGQVLPIGRADFALTPNTQIIAKDFRSFQLQSNKNTPLPDVVKKHGMDFEAVKTIKYDFLWASKNRERIIKRWSEQIFSQAR